MTKTTIQVSYNTLEKLKTFKKYNKQSYDEIIGEVLDYAADDYLTSEEIEDIKEALDEVKRGKTISIEEVAKKYKIKLKK